MKEWTKDDNFIIIAIEHYKKVTAKDMTPEGNFIIFAIEAYKSVMNMNGKDVIELFVKHNVFEHIRKSYSIYCTGREQNMIDDINEYIEESKAHKNALT